jgi:hypothetical protein
MFAYILKAPNTPTTEQTDEFFRRFCETPGLLYAFDITPVEDPNESLVVAVWQDRAAAERYLSAAPLRKEVDQAIPAVTRTMYEVNASK